jgi:AraC family transcriptional regulator of arabinose operon
MDLQYQPQGRLGPPTALMSAPFGRMHLLRDGFLYVGLISGRDCQRPSALIYLALTPEPFTIETPEGPLNAAAALVAPGVHKRFVGGKQPVVMLDVCPTHRSYRVFAQLRSGTQVLPRGHFDGLARSLRSFQDGSLRHSEADWLYGQLLDLAARCMPPLKPIDPRVRQVMRLLRQNRHRTIDELAEAVCLSKDWLVHLFQREAGISLRKFEQSLKLQTAATYVNSGVSLTEVAAIAGFADSAHFSKLWKQHYGTPPTRVFAGNELMTIDPLPAPPLHPGAHAEASLVRSA